LNISDLNIIKNIIFLIIKYIMSFPLKLAYSPALLPHLPVGALNTRSVVFEPNEVQIVDINTDGYPKFNFVRGYLQGGILPNEVKVTFHDGYYIVFPVGSEVSIEWNENGSAKLINISPDQPAGPVAIHPPAPQQGGKRRRTHRRRTHRRRTHRHRRRHH
jgi:hypothetical protein